MGRDETTKRRKRYEQGRERERRGIGRGGRTNRGNMGSLIGACEFVLLLSMSWFKSDFSLF